MAGRALLLRVEPGFSLPAYERFAPPPPPALVAARLEASSSPGDIVLDLFGRGGWVARAAIDSQRKAVSLESSALDRLLAEVVLRPPDLRHLDAAIQSLAASARRESSLKASITDRYASRCATCDRAVILDEVTWVAESTDEDGRPAGPRPIRKHYRCPVCRDQLGGGENRQAPVDAADIERAMDPDGAEVRYELRDRFPTLDGGEALVDELLDLHTTRQLVALAAILERAEGDLRAASIGAAMRLALLHAIAPASRLATSAGRVAPLKISGGHVKLPGNAQWRERNPWLAFEDGVRVVRGFIQRLESGTWGPVPARFGDDLRSLAEGAATAVVKQGTPAALDALGIEARHGAGMGVRPRVRLALGTPPLRPVAERLAWAYHGTAWVLGREAAATLPLEPLFGPAVRPTWGWQAAAITRALRAVEPVMGRDARVVLLLEGDGPESLVACTLGGVTAGYRMAGARLPEAGRETGGVVELVPPGSGAVPRGPRTRANQALDAASRRRRRPGPRPVGPAVRAGRARGQRPVLRRGRRGGRRRGRGRRAQAPRRAGVLRGAPRRDPRRARSHRPPPAPRAPAGARASAPEEDEPASGRPGSGHQPAPDPRAGTRLGTHRRPRRSPAHARADRAREGGGQAAASRWATIAGGSGRRPISSWRPCRSPTGSSGPSSASCPPPARCPRPRSWTASRACSRAPTCRTRRSCAPAWSRTAASRARRTACPPRDDLARRSKEHSRLIANLVDLGHRLGFSCWIGERQQPRRVGGYTLADYLEPRELSGPPSLGRIAARDLEDVDVIWYVRGKMAMAFEVEWTAMLSDTVLRHHARIPTDERLVRFLVVLPERVELVRHKLDRSPLLREGLDAGGWHLVKANHVRDWAAREQVELADLEPLLGLDPAVERTGDQLSLFTG